MSKLSSVIQKQVMSRTIYLFWFVVVLFFFSMSIVVWVGDPNDLDKKVFFGFVFVPLFLHLCFMIISLYERLRAGHVFMVIKASSNWAYYADVGSSFIVCFTAWLMGFTNLINLWFLYRGLSGAFDGNDRVQICKKGILIYNSGRLIKLNRVYLSHRLLPWTNIKYYSWIDVPYDPILSIGKEESLVCQLNLAFNKKLRPFFISYGATETINIDIPFEMKEIVEIYLLEHSIQKNIEP